jgi:hypothetical protein
VETDVGQENHAERDAIPAALRRDVLVEAGHRCAIPTCKQTPVEIAHIIPWAKVREHAFGNLIALCPTCHSRFDRGEIDRQAMAIYKANLSVLNGRYGELERRVLTIFAERPEAQEIRLPGGHDVFLMYLLQDRLLVEVPDRSGQSVVMLGMSAMQVDRLTDKGRTFVSRMANAESLDDSEQLSAQ